MRFALYPIISTFIYFNFVLCARGQQQSILDEFKNNPDFSLFLESLQEAGYIQFMLQDEMVTVFAPKNNVINDKYRKNNPDRKLSKETVKNHIVNVEVDKSYFEEGKSKETIRGDSFLYFRKVKQPNGDYDYFVNNAKILNINNVLKIKTEAGEDQYLYIIDEVLDKHSTVEADELLAEPSKNGIEISTSAFLNRIEKAKLEDLFNTGSNTYFIPVGGQDKNFNEIDETIIRGHVIPNKVLFTRTMRDIVYKSDMYDKSKGVEVELSMINISNANDNGFTVKIKSNTMTSKGDRSGPSFPRKGVVLVDLLTDAVNIPVKNGVVHLIKEPLMVINDNMWQILEREKDGRLSEFMKFVDQTALKNEFEDSSMEKTLFAPSNEAFNMIPKEKLNDLIYNDQVKLKQLIYLHMIQNSITSYDVFSNSQNANIPSMDRNRPLFFNVHGKEGNRTFTVEGGGVNATAIEADIGATNGIIHIINHVLGVPFKSILDKLKSDAKLSVTYELGKGSTWNKIFNARNRNFTLFVPNNEAWGLFEQDNPTTFKQLSLDGIYSGQIPKILDRHIILDSVLTREDILKSTKPIKTKSAELRVDKFKYGNSNEKYDDNFDLYWEEGGKKATIVRPDVKATNGIIHVINTVFMERDDVASGSDTTTTASIIATLISALIFNFIA